MGPKVTNNQLPPAPQEILATWTSQGLEGQKSCFVKIFRRILVFDPTMEKMEESLQCNICLEVPEGKVVQCRNSHIFCGSHKRCIYKHMTRLEPPVRCPVCRVDLGPANNLIRNRVAELAIGVVPDGRDGAITVQEDRVTPPYRDGLDAA